MTTQCARVGESLNPIYLPHCALGIDIPRRLAWRHLQQHVWTADAPSGSRFDRVTIVDPIIYAFVVAVYFRDGTGKRCVRHVASLELAKTLAERVVQYGVDGTFVDIT